MGQVSGALSFLWPSTSEDTVLPPSWMLFFIASYLSVPSSSWTQKYLFTEPLDLGMPPSRCRSKPQEANQ